MSPGTLGRTFPGATTLLRHSGAVVALLRIGLACIVAASGPAVLAAAPTAAFQKLVEEIWQYDLRESPLFATRVGDHRYDDRLPSVSRKDSARRAADKAEFLRQLRALDLRQLSADDQLNYRILTLVLEDELAEYRFRTDRMPITNREGFHIEFPELRRQIPLRTADDYRHYTARLKGFLEYARGHVGLMRQGIQEGLTLPAVVLQGFEQPLQAQIVDAPEKSLLYEPFTHIPEGIPAEEAAEIRRDGQLAIMEGVVTGYREFLQFMEKEYLPAARATIAASALPEGREFYRHRVRHFTTLDLTPEQVHETGLQEVARIRREMEQVRQEAGFSGNLRAFMDFLRSDPQFYADTPQALLQETALVLKRMDGQLPKLFGVLPRTPYGLREVPAYVAPLTTTAYYMPPAGDGTDAGYYYVNTYDLKSRPRYEIEALSLHEAVPGHHLQIALQQELATLPEFRRFTGFTAFVEGWALYAERLGMDTGFYQDPYSNFGRLTFEMWRACRLVVDTGMHAMGWSREQAIAYMEENTALARHNIRAEVDRYISWPGQAVAYKIGELKIRELRRQAEDRLGPSFDVRAFHDVVLGAGAVPLQVLEERIANYIESVDSK